MTNAVTFTFNCKDGQVVQHEFHTQLEVEDFRRLMLSEWMQDPELGTELTLEPCA